MNAYDAERMAEALVGQGYAETADIEAAELVILNTCHIREKAAEKVYSELGRVRQLKERRTRAGAETKIVVAGCVAQAEGGRSSRRAPMVDLVVGPQSYHRLPELVAQAGDAGRSRPNFRRKTNSTRLPERAERRGVHRPFSPCRKAATNSARSAWCLIRAARNSRGASTRISRKPRGLRASGVRELTLLGQNVNAYHGEGPDGRAHVAGSADQALVSIGLIDRFAT